MARERFFEQGNFGKNFGKNSGNEGVWWVGNLLILNPACPSIPPSS
jgi:hypothetical protein